MSPVVTSEWLCGEMSVGYQEEAGSPGVMFGCRWTHGYPRHMGVFNVMDEVTECECG